MVGYSTSRLKSPLYRDYADACTLPLLIVGVARDIESIASSEVQCLATAFADFQTIHWLIIESDSTDGTVQALRQSATNLRVLALGDLRERFPLRTERIAHCRNHYLRELEESPEYKAVEWIVVADLDGTNQMLDRGAVATCWTRDDWDVCCANQRGLYYDIWALRHPTWSPDDCWAKYRELVARGVGRHMALWAAVYTRMRRIPRGRSWIPVDSAFGGLAIYRRSVLHGARYVGTNDEGEEVCEHVALHAQLRARGHVIQINPALLNHAESEHTVPARVGRLKRWLNNARAVLIQPRTR